jgi:hypothetical protein
MNPAVAYITPFSHPSHPSDEGAASVFIGVFAPLHPFGGNYLYMRKKKTSSFMVKQGIGDSL